jgi:diguanylate cyclase (GGDEF)-like protein
MNALRAGPSVAERDRRARREGLPAERWLSPERAAARDRAHWLTQELQDGAPGAAPEVTALLARARSEGWPEVVRAALYADAVAALVAGDGRFGTAVTALRQQAEEDGDPVMEALALAMGARDNIDGGDPDAAVVADADLARATVMLDLVEGLDNDDAFERASARVAVGWSFGYRALWELEDEQYRAAEQIVVPGKESFLRAVVLFNRAELQMKWACALRELGEQDHLLAHCRAGAEAVHAALAVEMPPTWRTGLAVLELVLAALSGEEVADRARALEGEEPYFEFTSHAPLAEALADAHHGRRRSSVDNAHRALAGLEPGNRPVEHDLILCLLAEQHEPRQGGPSPALRYARRQVALRWQNRLAALAAMRSLIHGERLQGEHALYRRHAFVDDLTGLANRREFHRYMSAAAARRAGQLTVIICDVDRFKQVNDRWGHLVGDRVLVEIASVLSASVRPGDLAARFGGDEFVLVFDNSDLATAELRAADVVNEVAQRSWSAVQPGLDVGVSLGVAIGHPGRTDELLQRADLALYEAKERGGSCWASGAAAAPRQP